MKILQAEQRSPEWFEARKGKITGTSLKKLLGRKDMQENLYYELLAERLSVSNKAEDNETDLARGVRLESEAVETFEAKTKKKVERVGFIQSDFNKNIGCSPDGLIKVKGKYSEQVECKCLSSGNHVRAWLEKKVPDEYMPQVIQSFIVNEDLKTMYVVFYDPRIAVKPYHVIEVSRDEIAEQAIEYKAAQIEFLKKVEEKLSTIIKI